MSLVLPGSAQCEFVPPFLERPSLDRGCVSGTTLANTLRGVQRAASMHCAALFEYS